MSKKLSVRTFNLPGFRHVYIILATLAVAAMLILAGTAHAVAAEGAVQIMLTQRKVIKDRAGKEQKVDAANVLPGDIVEYQAIYRNVSKGRVSGLVADLPIPEGLAYVDGSASPSAGLKAAAVKMPTAANFSALPLVRKSADGKTMRLPLSDYRVLRWTVGMLEPGAQVVVRARAMVIAPEPVSSAARPNAQQAPPAKRGKTK